MGPRKWIQHTCERCGSCCQDLSYIETSRDDRSRWEREGREDILEFVVDRKLTAEEDGRCRFLGRDNGNPHCEIYPTRPEPCTLFPYTQDGDLQMGADRKCPVIIGGMI